MVIHVDGLVQDCSNSSALAMELLQSYTKPGMCSTEIKKIMWHQAQLQQGFQPLPFSIMLAQSIIFNCYGMFNITQIFNFSDCRGDSG